MEALKKELSSFQKDITVYLELINKGEVPQMIEKQHGQSNVTAILNQIQSAHSSLKRSVDNLVTMTTGSSHDQLLPVKLEPTHQSLQQQHSTPLYQVIKTEESPILVNASSSSHNPINARSSFSSPDPVIINSSSPDPNDKLLVKSPSVNNQFIQELNTSINNNSSHDLVNNQLYTSHDPVIKQSSSQQEPNLSQHDSDFVEDELDSLLQNEEAMATFDSICQEENEKEEREEEEIKDEMEEDEVEEEEEFDYYCSDMGGSPTEFEQSEYYQEFLSAMFSPANKGMMYGYECHDDDNDDEIGSMNGDDDEDDCDDDKEEEFLDDTIVEDYPSPSKEHIDQLKDAFGHFNFKPS